MHMCISSALKAQEWESPVAEKDGVERKVWLLPTELSERIKAYQMSQGITSEVEAARRLLDSALQMRDTVPDILRKLLDRYEYEKDLRILARDVLWNHALVKGVTFDDNSVSFEFRDESFGRLDKKGVAATGVRDNYEITWRTFPPPEYRPRARAAAPTWEAPKNGGSDLDDEIPF